MPPGSLKSGKKLTICRDPGGTRLSLQSALCAAGILYTSVKINSSLLPPSNVNEHKAGFPYNPLRSDAPGLDLAKILCHFLKPL